jgi:hypothetical protein
VPNTLGLDDELDDVDLIHDVEKVTGLRFASHETRAWYTVGDIFNTLCERYAKQDRDGGKCATAMAFHRLRQAAAQLVPGRITPDTKLDGFAGLPARDLYAQLQKRSGLKLPPVILTYVGVAGLLLTAAGVVAEFCALEAGLVWWEPYLALPVLGAGLMFMDPWRGPPELRTFGQLARKVAALNFSKLLGEGAARRDNDVWNALIETLSDHTDLPKSMIASDTLLLQSQLKKSA